MSNQTTDERDALLAALSEKFPKAAIKQREGARGKQLDYLETHTVIHRLNSAAKTWDWKLTQLQQQGDLLIAIGELTIPGLGTRTGIGVQKVSERGGEDLVKGASSDAMKKAATLFGVGLELWRGDAGSREANHVGPSAILVRQVCGEHAPRDGGKGRQRARLLGMCDGQDASEGAGALMANGQEHLLCVRTKQPLWVDVIFGTESYVRRTGSHPRLCLVSLRDGPGVAECGGWVHASGGPPVLVEARDDVRPGELRFYGDE